MIVCDSSAPRALLPVGSRVFFRWLTWLLVLVGGMVGGPVWGQVGRPVKGSVSDGATGAPIPGALIRLGSTAPITVTDGSGNFTFDLPAKPTGSLLIEAAGYKPVSLPFSVAPAEPLRVRLTALRVQLQGAEVVGAAGQADPDRHLRGSQLGETVLPMTALRVLPVLFGEADPVKMLALLPGVQTGGEGQTGLYVRGGGQDQNLTLLDGATLYNAGHLLNFFSVFNADALSTVSLLKTPGARYGGRLSSVLAVESRDGGRDSVRTLLGLGLISSRLRVEGPLGRRDSATGAPGSFLVAGRRTYVDLLTKPFLHNEQGGVPYAFYDLNGRLAWRLTPRDRVGLTLYHGRDDGRFDLAAGRLTNTFGWGNTAGSLTWQHTFRPNLRLRLTASATDYRFSFVSRFDTYTTRLLTNVRDYGGQAEVLYEPAPRHHLSLGLTAIDHSLRPRAGDAATDDGQRFTTSGVRTKQAQEAAAWLTDEWALTDRLLLAAGLRWSGLRQRGPFTQYTFTADGGRATDSVSYARGTTVATFATPEPRLSVRYELAGGRASVKVGYARTAQYLHLVSQTTSALPLDVWVPASALAPPQRAHNWSAGYFRTFGPQQEWEASAEVYYRTLTGQLEYRDGFVAGPANRDVEYDFVRGTGRAYGLELLARRTAGRWRGWVAYTLARATRRFADLNGGARFPFRFDQRHNLNVVGTYDLTPRWQLGGTFVLASGQAITMPERRYFIGNALHYQYGPRNGFRMATQHRFDVAATWQRPPRRWGRTRWQFSVYNVYGRRNPWFYYLEPSGDLASGTTRLTAKSVALFPIPVPAVTWEVEF